MEGTINNEALLGFVGEIERKFEDRKYITDELREIYERAKAAGFVPAFLRQMVKERQLEDRAARYRTLDEYRLGLGLLGDTPLGEAAMGRAHDDLAAEKPRPFAEQPVHEPRRGRPRPPVLFDADHPLGTA